MYSDIRELFQINYDLLTILYIRKKRKKKNVFTIIVSKQIIK